MKNMNTFLMETGTLRTSDGVGFNASLELSIQAANCSTIESDETVQKIISEDQNYLRILYQFQHELRLFAIQHPINGIRPLLDVKMKTLLEMFAEIFEVKIMRSELQSDYFRQMAETHQPRQCQRCFEPEIVPISPLFSPTFPRFSMISGCSFLPLLPPLFF
jgi:hypothetical protein